MLRRSVPAAGTAVAVMVAGLALLVNSPASADTSPCEGDWVCVGTGTSAPPSSTTSTPPADSTGGGEPVCTWNGAQFPCSDKDLGWFNGSDGCYWRLVTPQPPAGDPSWQGHAPGDGAVYSRACRDMAGGLTAPGAQWSKNPPPGMGGGVDLAGLARQAVDKMLLADPAITTAPKSGSTGLIGMPVWLSAAVSPTTWGPNTASANAGAVTVTATAHVTSVAWSMGDGHTVTCTSAGTPYDTSYGDRSSPDCGYTYATTSAGQPHGQFHIRALATWIVDWTGAGQQGQFTLTRTSVSDVAIAQAQAVVKS